MKNGHLAQENLADEPDYQAVLTDLRDRLDHHLARAVLPLRRPDDAAGTVRKMSSLYGVTKRVGLLSGGRGVKIQKKGIHSHNPMFMVMLMLHEHEHEHGQGNEVN